MEKEPIPDVMDVILDAATLDGDTKKLAAKATAKSYVQLAYVAAKSVPLCVALSATPSISQLPARQPEMDAHFSTQLGHPLMLEEPPIIATTSGGPTWVSASFTSPVEALQGVATEHTVLVEVLGGVSSGLP